MEFSDVWMIVVNVWMIKEHNHPHFTSFAEFRAKSVHHVATVF
jgi:hypothetical protein